MQDEYDYLRMQYQEIIEHCNYLLRSSAEPKVLAKAYESKTVAEQELARLNRATGGKTKECKTDLTLAALRAAN